MPMQPADRTNGPAVGGIEPQPPGAPGMDAHRNVPELHLIPSRIQGGIQSWELSSALRGSKPGSSYLPVPSIQTRRPTPQAGAEQTPSRPQIPVRLYSNHCRAYSGSPQPGNMIGQPSMPGSCSRCRKIPGSPLTRPVAGKEASLLERGEIRLASPKNRLHCLPS